jgi:hypothetical protein
VRALNMAPRGKYLVVCYINAGGPYWGTSEQEYDSLDEARVAAAAQRPQSIKEFSAEAPGKTGRLHGSSTGFAG